MTRIKKLTPQEAQKIAAGEVVERPANIVKELIENALDACATHITIYIENGGKNRIRVIDNGIGMDYEDAHLCFEHHATSKISSVDDLTSISTFGFRGEALSSISSVSKVTLITKQKESIEAIKIIRNNDNVHTSTISSNTGTDITIDDLFYNVPARKKFLKQKETEWRHIQQLFCAISLHYKNVHFKLYSENKLLFNCPPTDSVQERWQALFSDMNHSNTIAIKPNEKSDSTLSGIISNHHYGRYDRSGIYFFVNNRWIKNHILSRSFIDGYNNILPPHQYPMGYIAITVDPLHIDINIHPRKEEVQFLHPNKIRDHIKKSVTEALESTITQQLKKPFTTLPQPEPSYSVTTNSLTFSSPLFHAPQQKSSSFIPFNFDSFFEQHDGSEIDHRSLLSSPIENALSETSPEGTAQQTNLLKGAEETACFNVIGTYNKTYILVEKDDAILFVDQHAAHERILFEQFANTKHHTTVQLLFPQTISLSKELCSLLEPYLQIFNQNGIEIEQLSEDKLVIKAMPVQLKNVSIESIIQHTLAWLHEEKGETPKEKFTKMIHADMACKAAVKAGDVLSEKEILTLLSDLHITNNKMACPHGRPTTWLLPLDSIKKKFKRDYRT